MSELESKLLSDAYFNAGVADGTGGCTAINYLKKWGMKWYAHHLWRGGNRCERCGKRKP